MTATVPDPAFNPTGDHATGDHPTGNHPTGNVVIERWSPARMRARLSEIIGVYKAAFLDVHESDPRRAAIERTMHARRHTERRDLRVVVALTSANRVAGFGYALPGQDGQWWHDVVRGALAPEDGEFWLGSCLEIVELHVRPEFQGRGIGRAVIRELVRDAPFRTAALSALEIPGSRARRLYASEGFQPLLSHFQFPGSTIEYAVLARRLPPPSSAGRSRSRAGSRWPASAR
jgi:GNAT superfamily N-acetyltransferase